MNRGNVLMVVVVLLGCVWRGLWLSAGVTDSTSVADATRTKLLRQIADELKARGRVAGPQDLHGVQQLRPRDRGSLIPFNDSIPTRKFGSCRGLMANQVGTVGMTTKMARLTT